MNIKQIGILIVIAVVFCAVLYFIIGPGWTVWTAMVYIVASFVPIKKLWTIIRRAGSLLFKVVKWVDDLIDPPKRRKSTGL